MGWPTVLQGQHLLNDVILSANHNILIESIIIYVISFSRQES